MFIQDVSLYNPDILKRRKKKAGVGTLWKYLRKQSGLTNFSDIILLNHILGVLRENNLPFSRNEVYGAFKRVDKDDYPKELKRTLLRQCYEGAIERLK